MPKDADFDLVLKKPRPIQCNHSVSSLFPDIYKSTSMVADIYSRLCP